MMAVMVMNFDSISAVWKSEDVPPATTTTTTSSSSTFARRRLLSTSSVKLYYDIATESSTLFRRFQQELTNAEAFIDVSPLNVNTPNACPENAKERIRELLRLDQQHLALEVLKYCSVVHNGGSGLFLDAGASVLVDTLSHLVTGYGDKNIAVLNDPFLPFSIHGGLVFFHPNHAAANIAMANRMLETLVSTNIEALISTPTLLPKSLYDSMAQELNRSQLAAGPDDHWYFLQHSCTIEPLGGRQATVPISALAMQSYRYVDN